MSNNDLMKELGKKGGTGSGRKPKGENSQPNDIFSNPIRIKPGDPKPMGKPYIEDSYQYNTPNDEIDNSQNSGNRIKQQPSLKLHNPESKMTPADSAHYASIQETPSKRESDAITSMQNVNRLGNIRQGHKEKFEEQKKIPYYLHDKSVSNKYANAVSKHNNAIDQHNRKYPDYPLEQPK